MKQKTKKVLKLLLIVLIAFSLIFNTQISFAADGAETTQAEDGGVNAMDVITGLLDGILGIFLNILNIIPVTIGGVIQMISASIANIGGMKFAFLQLDDILFNKVPILSVNFFATSGNGVVTDIRASIATWYYALRNLAIILSLAVLIYIGIRMVISTIAEDKARYKKMLVDWVVGFITIFLLHYIIVITVNVNDYLVSIFASHNEASTLTGSFAGDLALNGVNLFGGFVKGFTSSILYVFLTVMIMMFLISYIKRMLTVAFLIIIAPIITVTYSIDKIGDGKSQALNTWLKEFIYNVLIQPFHCIIYLAFMNIVMSLVGTPANTNWFDGAGLGAAVFAIFTMLFIKQAEPIVRRIFGFDNASSLGSALASGALLMSSMKTASNAISGAKGKAQSGASGSKGPRPKTSNNATRNQNNINSGQPGNRNSTSKPSSNNQSSQPNASNPAGQSGQQSQQNQSAQNGQQNQSNQTGQQNQSNPNGQTGQQNASNPAGQPGQQSQQNQSAQNGQQNSSGNELNTNRSQSGKDKFKNFAKKLPSAYTHAGFRVAGAAIGAFASDDFVTGAMTGYNYGKAFGVGAVNTGRKISNTATRKTRLRKQTSEFIDAYKKLQKDTGWSDDLMYDQSERLLQLSPETLQKVSNPKVRAYGETLHKYREQYEGRYQEPSDMVLHTIRQVQNGTLKNDKDSIKRYTRKK